jgi:hypothetical protein
MTLFCTAGDTARVTFPDGTIRDYTGTPIDVAISQVNPTKNQYIVVALPYRTSSGATRIDTYAGVTFRDDVISIGKGDISGRDYMPFPGKKPHGTVIALLADGTFQLVCYDYGNYDHLAPILYKGNNVITPTYRLVVKNSVGVSLFSGTYATSSYTVQCIAGCPPNTLDCGNCCLNCADTFNGITNILRIISRLN